MTHGGGMRPLRWVCFPAGGGLLARAPDDPCGAVSEAGRMTHGGGHASLAVGMLPCGGGCACACFR